MIMYTVFYIVYSLFVSFLNVYLFEYTNSFIIMALFVSVRMVPFCFTSLYGNKISQKFGFPACMIIGSIFLILSLLFALLASDLFIINGYYSLIVAFLCGIGFGLTWYVVNTLTQIVPDNNSRSYFLAIKSVFGNLAGMLAPAISTIILSLSVSDDIGYRYILICVIVLCIAVCFLTKNIDVKKTEGQKFSLLDCLRFDDKNQKYIILGSMYYGFYDGLFLTLTGVMISNATSSGTLYSSLLTVFSILGVIACRFVHILVRKEFIKINLVVNGIMSIASTIVLALCSNMFGAIFYGVTHAIFFNYFDQTTFFIDGQITTNYPNDVERIVSSKAVYNSLGRIIAMSLIALAYWLIPSNLTLSIGVIICSLFPIVVIVYDFGLLKELYK